MIRGSMGRLTRAWRRLLRFLGWAKPLPPERSGGDQPKDIYPLW